MQVSKFNTLEPCTAPITPEIIDFAIIPCLMADKQKFRLGYGGGYYDKLIPNLKQNCIKLCALPAKLLQKELPIEHFDQSVDLICTEEELF